MVLAIDEACSSIILNAKEHGATGNLRLLIDIDPTRVKVNVSDTGNDYDMGEVTREQLLREFTKSRKNELGTFLIRRIEFLDEQVLIIGIRRRNPPSEIRVSPRQNRRISRQI